MKKKFRKYILLILIFPMLNACSTFNKLFIEKDKSFVNNKENSIKKIVAIMPTMYVIDPKKKSSYKKLKKTINKLDAFEASLKENAKLNKIELQIVSANNLNTNDVDFFNVLKPLRDQIILSNIYQNPELSSKGIKGNYFKAPMNYFNTLPRISPDYSKLVEKYKTKYFSVNGVFSLDGRFKASNFFSLLILPPYAFKTNAETYYYTIVVDIEKSEIVYREIRGIDELVLKTNLDGILYDSYNIIKSKK